MLEPQRPVAARIAALSPSVLRARSVRLALIVLAFLAAALLLAPRPAAQTFLYALNEKGKVCLNQTVLDQLKSQWDPETFENGQEAWWDLEALGADRYAMRIDGRVAKNGQQIYKLPFVLFPNAPQWLDMSLTADTLWVLRSDGLLTADGGEVVNYPEGLYFFDAVLGDGTDVYALRTDGTVFRGTSTDPLIKFTGGPGIGGALDGQGADTQWFAMAIDPVTGELLAARRDGVLWKQDPDEDGDLPLEGVKITDQLPFPTVTPIFENDAYWALAIDADGVWHILRGNGQVFTSASVIDPLIDLPAGNVEDPDGIYRDLRLTDDGFFALRSDGSVFDENGTKLFEMANANYRHLALTDTPPDLTNFKNPKPVQAIYKTRAIENVPVTVPILASDIEKLPADLIVTAPDPLPAGAAWDDVTRTLSWPTPGPAGTYKFITTVDDGVNDPRTFKHSIKVQAADVDALKNKPPIPTKISPVQALVDHEISFQVFAVDPDGDPLTFTVNTAKPPFDSGATFDDVTNTFTWTPTFDDIGKVIATFKVSDGLKTVPLAVTIKVVNGLVFEVEPPPP
jgi:hypothetical protein